MLSRVRRRRIGMRPRRRDRRKASQRGHAGNYTNIPSNDQRAASCAAEDRRACGCKRLRIRPRMSCWCRVRLRRRMTRRSRPTRCRRAWWKGQCGIDAWRGVDVKDIFRRRGFGRPVSCKMNRRVRVVQFECRNAKVCDGGSTHASGRCGDGALAVARKM